MRIVIACLVGILGSVSAFAKDKNDAKSFLEKCNSSVDKLMQPKELDRYDLGYCVAQIGTMMAIGP